MLCHAHGYVPAEKDFQDMARLQLRFGVELPPHLRRGGGRPHESPPPNNSLEPRPKCRRPKPGTRTAGESGELDLPLQLPYSEAGCIRAAQFTLGTDECSRPLGGGRKGPSLTECALEGNMAPLS